MVNHTVFFDENFGTLAGVYEDMANPFENISDFAVQLALLTDVTLQLRPGTTYSYSSAFVSSSIPLG